MKELFFRKLVLFTLLLSLDCEQGKGNIPPLAIVTKELQTFINEPLRLDGSKSTDPDGDDISFYWEITSAPAGSNSLLREADTASPLFIGDAQGIYTAALVVNDGKVPSEPDEARILVFADNYTPIADAGDERSIYITDEVILDGRMSADPQNRPLSFYWFFLSKPEGSKGLLTGADEAVAVFKPDIPHSEYEIQLVVSNGLFTSNPDMVRVSILNSAPEADAGENKTLRPGNVTILNGSGSDPDGDEIKGYSWQILSHPGNPSVVFLERPDTHEPVLHTDSDPDALGDYVIELKIYDGELWSEPDRVILSTYNSPPNVNAGADRSVGHCYSGDYFATDMSTPTCPSAPKLRLIATASDPDGDPMAYQWSVVSSPPGAPTPVFSAPDKEETDVDIRSDSASILGTYTFQFTATDSYGKSSSDEVSITVTNRPPTAGSCTAGCLQSITRSGCTAMGSLCYTQPVVQFDNIQTKGIDPDNDPVTNEFYLAPNGGLNCVKSLGNTCGSEESCYSSLRLEAFAIFGCSSTSTYAGANTVRIRFRDGFGAMYDDATDDGTYTVYCSSCN